MIKLSRKITLNVNGKNYEVLCEAGENLRDVLREKLGFLGVKKGCDFGGCGACTVIIDDNAVYSCMTWAYKAEGKKITTIEGLSSGRPLHPVQEAFIALSASQCGYCTPGIVMSALALLNKNPKPSFEEIKEALAGNMCRCTGYVRYIKAIVNACKNLKKFE
ncbi:MAG: (2Fe-2S)-binding protein [Nitrososphaerales archaeon]